jgi:hypothetical protein
MSNESNVKVYIHVSGGCVREVVVVENGKINQDSDVTIYDSDDFDEVYDAFIAKLEEYP